MRVVRGRLRGGRERRGRPRDDPDRQLDRRPGRRHPPLPARLGAAHRRRALPADPVLPDGACPGASPRARSRRCTATCTRWASAARSSASTASRRSSPATPPARPARSPRPATRRRPRSRPPLAAEIYGLEILRRRRRGRGPQHHPLRGALARARRGAAAGNGPVVTSFVFNVRNLPAALYKALGGFATNGVNMTKLESYMVGGRVHRHPVPRRGRRAPRRRRARARARGARVLHHRRQGARGLPGRPVPGRGLRLAIARPRHRRRAREQHRRGDRRATARRRAGRSRPPTSPAPTIDCDLSTPDGPDDLLAAVTRDRGRVDALVLSHAHDVETGVLDTTARELRPARRRQRSREPAADRGFARQVSDRRRRRRRADQRRHHRQPALRRLEGRPRPARDRRCARARAASAISANVLNPGPVDTGWMDDELREGLAQHHPLGPPRRDPRRRRGWWRSCSRRTAAGSPAS